MFKKKKNTYDATSVIKGGGVEYGSSIHGIAISVNQVIWDMMKVLKEKKLFGFHFKAKLGVKRTIVVMTHPDKKMVERGKKVLHEFQEIENIILLAKIETSSDTSSDDPTRQNREILWKSKTGISSIIGILSVLAGIVFYIMNNPAEKEPQTQAKTEPIQQPINIVKNIEINAEMMEIISKNFDNKENKLVKSVLANVLEITTSTDILEKIPLFEKVTLDKEAIIKSYQDPNITFTLTNAKGSSQALNEFALEYAKENNISQAKSIYQDLIKLGKEAGKKNPEHLKGVAQTLNNLGDAYIQEGKIKKAEKAYQKALNIHKKLETKKPSQYALHKAWDLTKLAQLYENQKKHTKAKEFYTKAQKQYQQAVEIYRTLVKKDAKKFQPYLAWSLNTLANTYLNPEENLSQAVQPKEEALSIYKKLEKEYPKEYTEHLLLTLYTTGSLYNQLELYKKAEVRYHEVVTHSKEINSTTIRVKEYQGKALNSLAWIHTKQPKLRDFEKAKLELHEAIKLYNVLIVKNPKQYNPILSLSYSNLGYIATIEEKIDLAINSYKKAINLVDNFDNAMLYVTLLSHQKRFQETNEIFASIEKKYTQPEQQAYLLMNYGTFYMNIDPLEAQYKLEKSLKIYQEISKKSTQSYLLPIEKLETLLKKETTTTTI